MYWALKVYTDPRRIGMASKPLPHNPPAVPAEKMIDDHWWSVFFSLQGSATKELEQVGGADAWFEYLRHGDEEPS